MNPIIIRFYRFLILVATYREPKCEKNKIKTGKTKQNNQMLWVGRCNVFEKKGENEILWRI